MKTSIRLSLLIILFLGLMPSSCYTGKCDNPGEYKLLLNDLDLQFNGLGLDLDTPITVIPEGDFRIRVRLLGDEHYVMNTAPSGVFFTQSLMALDCVPSHCSGFKVAIDSFTISCDTAFLGQPAGTPLNPYFNAHYFDLNSPQWQQEIIVPCLAFNDSLRMDEEFLVDPQQRGTFFFKAIEFIETGNYRFTVTMLLKDGTLITKESDRVYFY